MLSMYTTFALTILTSFIATQSFAGGGEVGSAGSLMGSYAVEGPVNDPGDENIITFLGNGGVVLNQKSVWGSIECKGTYQAQNRQLDVVGTCSDSSNFKMQIEISEDATSTAYFSATVLSGKIYPKPVTMSFRLLK